MYFLVECAWCRISTYYTNRNYILSSLQALLANIRHPPHVCEGSSFGFVHKTATRNVGKAIYEGGSLSKERLHAFHASCTEPGDWPFMEV